MSARCDVTKYVMSHPAAIILTFVAVAFLVLYDYLSFQHSRTGEWHPQLQLQHDIGGNDTPSSYNKVGVTPLYLTTLQEW